MVVAEEVIVSTTDKTVDEAQNQHDHSYSIITPVPSLTASQGCPLDELLGEGTDVETDLGSTDEQPIENLQQVF
jgi:hypothetical protein